MKHILPFLCFLFSSSFVFAQFENFDLSKYKLPEIKRQQLDFQLNHQNELGKNLSDNSFFNLYNTLSAKYSLYQNSAKKQADGWFNVDSDITLNWEKSDLPKYVKDNQYNLDLDIGYEDRFYPQKNKFFLHFLPRIQMFWRNSYTFYPSEDTLDFKSKSRYRNLEVWPGFTAGIGTGRIEFVGDLRSALYILETLKKNQRLAEIPTESDIYRLAEKISKLRNERFFDARLRRIYEIKSLDSLLYKMGVVNQPDAVYFTALNDIWAYSYEPRYSGSRLQFDVNGRLLYNFTRNNTEYHYQDAENYRRYDNNNHYDESLEAALSFTSYKPMGLKWQQYFNVRTAITHYYIDNSNREYNKDDYNYFSVDAGVNYKWFLNTRTSANYGIYGQYRRKIYTEGNQSSADHEKGLNVNLNIGLSYYFSPRLQLSFRSNLFVYSNIIEYPGDSNTLKSSHFSNQIAFNYAIF